MQRKLGILTLRLTGWQRINRDPKKGELPRGRIFYKRIGKIIATVEWYENKWIPNEEKKLVIEEQWKLLKRTFAVDREKVVKKNLRRKCLQKSQRENDWFQRRNDIFFRHRLEMMTKTTEKKNINKMIKRECCAGTGKFKTQDLV